MTTTTSNHTGTRARRATASNTTPGLESRGRTRGSGSGPRQVGQWFGAALFILVVAVAAGWLYLHKGHQTEVLEVTKNVPAGAVLTRADVASVSVSGVTGAIPISQLSTAVGKTLVVGLTTGQVVTAGVLTSSPIPGTGYRVVAALVAPGRVPGGVGAGAVVDVLAAPPSSASTGSTTQLNDPTVLASAVQVLSISTSSAATSNGSGGVELSLLVPVASANQIAEYAAVGQIVLVQAPLGGGQ